MLNAKEVLFSKNVTSAIKKYTTEYFFIIYGSYAISNHKPDSDIDILIVTKNRLSEERRTLLQDNIIELMIDFNYTIDNEVPYDNKLIVTWRDVETAISLGWLELLNDYPFVPPIVKNSSFLSSQKMKERLIFNVLNTRNLFVSGVECFYKKATYKANLSLTVLVFLINNIKYGNIEYLTETLIKHESCEGEMYLGFKPLLLVKEHLRSIFVRIVQNHPDLFYMQNDLCVITPEFYEKEKERITLHLMQTG